MRASEQTPRSPHKHGRLPYSHGSSFVKKSTRKRQILTHRSDPHLWKTSFLKIACQPCSLVEKYILIYLTNILSTYYGSSHSVRDPTPPRACILGPRETDNKSGKPKLERAPWGEVHQGRRPGRGGQGRSAWEGYV